MMLRNGLFMVMILLGTLHAAATDNKHPHYVFTLPSGYIGWVQVIFNDPRASPLPSKDGGYVIEIPESGIYRTSDIRVHDFDRTDEFYYRSFSQDGIVELHSMPPELVLSGDSHGGFGVMDTGGKGPGYSWFIFIGPPALRAKTPLADWDKVVEDYRKSHGGKSRVEWSGPYPTPGRMRSDSRSVSKPRHSPTTENPYL